MTKSNILFIGLDVHKESIEVAMAEDGFGDRGISIVTNTDNLKLIFSSEFSS